MSLTEELLHSLALNTLGSPTVPFTEKITDDDTNTKIDNENEEGNSEGEEEKTHTVMLDFSPPYRKVDVWVELEKLLGEKLPVPTELHTEGKGRGRGEEGTVGSFSHFLTSPFTSPFLKKKKKQRQIKNSFPSSLAITFLSPLPPPPPK